MAKKEPRKEFLEADKWHALMSEYEKADDRSCAILCSAYLDVCLEVVLLEALAHSDEARGLLFEDLGPLGTFSAKINMAYCLNLIDEDAKKDLHFVRKIRNEFAHKLHGLSFKTNPVQSWCNELSTPKEWAKNTEEVRDLVLPDPRQRYIFTCSITSGFIEAHSHGMALLIHDAIINAKLEEQRPW